MAVPASTREEVEALKEQPMSDDCPKCEKCGLEITTGLMAGLCQYATECTMWPHSNGDRELEGGELFMAHVWMDNACKQIALQIDDRKRLEQELADRKVDIERLVQIGADQSRALSEAPEMPRWIPVEERLPSGYDRCLAHPSNYKYDRNPTAVYSPSTGKWTQTDSNGYDCEIPVTHWMPLPEAPK